MATTILNGTTPLNEWTAWTAVQHGSSNDPGYVTKPPGRWITPSRAIMKEGDLVGVVASCFSGCGSLSVEFSLNNGTVLVVSTSTVETDEWGTSEAYWFKLPAGLSNGLHEIRARIKPSSSGLERLLQGNTLIGSQSMGFVNDSLYIAVDDRNYYAQVAVGGTATGTTGVATGSTPNTSLPKYASIGDATTALALAMGNNNGCTAGATIYLYAGSWSCRPGYQPDNNYWVTIKGAPGVAKADVKIAITSNATYAIQMAFLKVQDVTLVLQETDSLFYIAGGTTCHSIWLDNCIIEGRGQTLNHGGLIANSTYKYHYYTRVTCRNANGGSLPWHVMLRHVNIANCTGDIFTGGPFVIHTVVTGHRGLGHTYTGPTDTEHADFYQNLSGLDNLILRNIDAEVVRLEDDVGVATFQVETGATASNFLIQDIHLKGFEGQAPLSFLGIDPVGVLIRNVTTNTWLNIDSRGTNKTYKGCEIVNCIAADMTSSLSEFDVIAKLKAVGRYEGNHYITGSRTEAQWSTGNYRTLADSTDTIGIPVWDTNSQIPVDNGNLTNRNTFSKLDAAGRTRNQTKTTAGAFSAPSEWNQTNSITRHGVTWTFDKNYTTGQYANGDWWVVGPATIISISPISPAANLNWTQTDGIATAVKNGTVINPQPSSQQGFNQNIDWQTPYDDNLNIANKLPQTVQVNSSIVSSISGVPSIPKGLYQIDSYAILTVVSVAPAPGSFRPPYMGSTSRVSQWNVSNLDYSKLNTLPSAALLTVRPDIVAAAAKFSKVWYEQDLNATGWYLHPPYMGGNGYGREMSVDTGDAALLLQLDYTNAQKEPLLISFVQYGIDISGIILAGGTWYADGGHNVGRLSPLLIAAFVLNDVSLKQMVIGSALTFQEFQTTFFVTQGDVERTDRVVVNGVPVYPYTTNDIGMPEWGIRHSSQPWKDNNNWRAAYRGTNGGLMTAPAMVAQVMGVRSAVNWEPMFQYAARHLEYEQSTSYKGEFDDGPTTPFPRAFYNAYKAVTTVLPTFNTTLTTPVIYSLSAGGNSLQVYTRPTEPTDVIITPAASAITVAWTADQEPIFGSFKVLYKEDKVGESFKQILVTSDVRQVRITENITGLTYYNISVVAYNVNFGVAIDSESTRQYRIQTTNDYISYTLLLSPAHFWTFDTDSTNIAPNGFIFSDVITKDTKYQLNMYGYYGKIESGSLALDGSNGKHIITRSTDTNSTYPIRFNPIGIAADPNVYITIMGIFKLNTNNNTSILKIYATPGYGGFADGFQISSTYDVATTKSTITISTRYSKVYPDAGEQFSKTITSLPIDTGLAHITVTIKSGEQKLYINGNLHGVSDLTGPDNLFKAFWSDYELVIGGNEGGWITEADNISIFKKILTQQEILGLTNTALNKSLTTITSLVTEGPPVGPPVVPPVTTRTQGWELTTSSPATLGEAIVSTEGTFVQAKRFGVNTNLTINNVTFTGTALSNNSGEAAAVSDAFAVRGIASDSLISLYTNLTFSILNNTHIISDLIIGRYYLIQWFFGDERTNYGIPTRNQTVSFAGYAFTSDKPLVAASRKGYFVATATSMPLLITGGENGHIMAFQVREIA